MNLLSFKKSHSRTLAAMQFALKQLEAYQSVQLPKAQIIETTKRHPVRAPSRAIDAVGLYHPRSSAPLISTVLNARRPARIAGCSLRNSLHTPNKSGSIDPNIFSRSPICGIDKIFKVGGGKPSPPWVWHRKASPK